MRVAVVTGANKGIGFAIVKALCQRFDGIVYLTSRDTSRGANAVAELQKLGLKPEYHQLDVCDSTSIIKFRDYLKQNYGGIDILINNAGVSGKGFTPTYEDSKRVIDISYKSLLNMQELLFPLVRNNGRILNISSSCGHLSNLRNKFWIDKLSSANLSVEDINEFCNWFLSNVKNGTFDKNDFADEGTVAAYRVAKVAVSALTIVQQNELKPRNISVNSMHPGSVRTDMTMGFGVLTTDEAAKTPVYIVLEAPDSLKGSYIWHDKRVLDWYDYKADHYFKIKSFLKRYGVFGTIIMYLLKMSLSESARYICLFLLSILFVYFIFYVY